MAGRCWSAFWGSRDPLTLGDGWLYDRRAVGPGARCVDGNACCWQSSGLVWWWFDRQHGRGRDQRARTVAFLPPQVIAMIVVAVLLLGWMVARLGDFTRSMFAPDIFG